jgi:rod shape-determining protein MreD
MTEVRRAPVAVAVGLVLLALVVELAVLSRLPLPGATPALVLLVVVSLALLHGPTFGVGVGFGAGLALDLLPPSDHAVGRWALVLCLVGYLAGLAEDEVERSAWVPVAVAGAASALSVLLFAGVGALFDDPRISPVVVLDVLPTAVLYDVILSPFVVFAVFTLVRRAEPR